MERGRERAAAAPDARAVAGRSAELAVLRRALEYARAGRTQVVVVEGEPGIGKSALLEAFLADPVEGLTPPAVGAMRRVRAGLPARCRRAPGRRAVTGCSEVEAGRRLLAMLGEQQNRGPRNGPAGTNRHVAVVVVDDAQWMDRLVGVRPAVRAAPAPGRPRPLSPRPTPQPRRHARGQLGLRTDHPGRRRSCARGGSTRALSPSSPRPARSGAHPRPGEATRRAAGGLPLLVAAVVRGAADEDELAAVTVTASVAGTVRQLLASLDPEARRLVEAAAVLAEPRR